MVNFNVTELKGGLGNQMFQYAFGILFSDKIKMKFDLFFFSNVSDAIGVKSRNFELNIFKNKIESISTKERNYFLGGGLKLSLHRFLFGRPYIFDEDINCRPNSSKKRIYFRGYFQNYAYFNNYKEQLFEIFQFDKTKLNYATQILASEMNAKNSLSLHIRRSDYISDEQTNKVFCSLDLEYYYSAIEKVKAHVGNQSMYVYIFSDDCNWVRDKFQELENVKVVDVNKGVDSWQDMYLMTCCKNNITANSTFSWWGAFLNPTPNKMVIAPKNWYYNAIKNQNAMYVYPKEWILI